MPDFLRTVLLVVPVVVVSAGVSCTPSPPDGTLVDEAVTTIRDNDHVLAVGNPRVTVIEYADAECPFCVRFAREIYPVIRQNYVDTGKVRWVFRQFPLAIIHPTAQKAAEAAECAADQGRFWEYHDMLFENSPALSVADLKAYAGELGLDQAAFDACVDGGEKAARVQEDFDSGVLAGFAGTPAFLINGALHTGFSSVEKFSVLLDAAIAAAGG